MVRYSIAHLEAGARPRNAEDFTASFRVGYNEQEKALFVAVEVRDESTVIDSSESYDLDRRDGCRVEVDMIHRDAPTRLGDFITHGGDRAIAEGAEDGQPGPAREVQLSTSRNETTYLYEWRLQLRLQSETTLGARIGIHDRDEDGSYSWIQWGNGNKLGPTADLVLTRRGVGRLRGKMKWEEADAGVARGKVVVRPALTNTFSVQTVTDRDGAFAVELPVGNYVVQPGPGRGPIQRVVAEVTPGSDVEVNLVAPRPQGLTQEAGDGFRMGSWLSFGNQDGLPSDAISCAIQGRDGRLWLGTAGSGVVCYDGVNFTSFTTADGLPSNYVTSMVEDKRGDIWFGTAGDGVSRYDGQHLSTLTAADGLACNHVTSILADRTGNVWFGTRAGITRMNEEEVETFTTVEGLATNAIDAIFEDGSGVLWFGGDGVTRYDGSRWLPFPLETDDAIGRVGSILEDRAGDFWFGTDTGAIRYDGDRFTTFTATDGLAGNRIATILEDRQGTMWFGSVTSGVSRFNGEEFESLTNLDGLVNDQISTILEDREGDLWFGTSLGISRYSGQRFLTLTKRNGLASNYVTCILEDRQGNLWFGGTDFRNLETGGLSRFDGREISVFTTEDGLPGHRVRSMLEDRRGHLWFGTYRGVSRFDGTSFKTFTTADGLAHNQVRSILEDRHGNIWFGTPQGASRFDGTHFSTIGKKDGLPTDYVWCMYEDRQGQLWFGTVGDGGASRYDGTTFETFTAHDGLATNDVRAILEDRKGNLWFATPQGASRFDGTRFTTFSVDNGLPGISVRSLLEDQQGHIWFGTSAGVSRYDGRVFQGLSRRDGLSGTSVEALHQDRSGDIWMATLDGGLTRYRRPLAAPDIHLTDVVADRRYGPVAEVRLSSQINVLAFEYQGKSLTTRPDQMAYLYRLLGYEDEWRPTRKTRVEYADLPTGTFDFQLRAVDRDLSYSHQTEVMVTVHPPYQIVILFGSLGIAVVGLIVVAGYAIKKRRDLFVEMEQELQTARDLQLGLMPNEAPTIEGLEIASRCVPATQVGGDFFQYFRHGDNLSISTADVAGHAMQAAIPVVMFEGVLDTHLRLGAQQLEDLFSRLNEVMADRLTGRTHVCFSMAQIDINTRKVRFANAGCPYPYHYHAGTGEVTELEANAYPFGVRVGTSYQAIETQLKPGDRLVFCSDGIMEARNAAGQMFGFDQTAETVCKGCQAGLSAEGLLEKLLNEVRAFSGDNPQEDDQTIVVVGVES